MKTCNREPGRRVSASFLPSAAATSLSRCFYGIESESCPVLHDDLNIESEKDVSFVIEQVFLHHTPHPYHLGIDVVRGVRETKAEQTSSPA